MVILLIYNLEIDNKPPSKLQHYKTFPKKVKIILKYSNQGTEI